MQERMYGYVRVSSKDQNEDRQLIALKAFGVHEKRIFIDKQSGKDFARPQYVKMLRTVRRGDIIVTGSIDRLGRNYNEIIEQWRLVTKERKVEMVILDMPLLDTRKKDRDLTGAFVADLVLQILSYVAQTERENIRRRQREGIDAARKRGVRFGRPRIELDARFEGLKSAWLGGNITAMQAADELDVSYKTFLRRVREEGENDGKTINKLSTMCPIDGEHDMG